MAELAGIQPKNPSAQPHKWKKDGAIFAIHHKGTDYYPLYALNADDNFRPNKALAEVIKIFGDRKTGWGLAYSSRESTVFWTTTNQRMFWRPTRRA